VQKLTQPFSDRHTLLVGCALGALIAAVILVAAVPAFAGTSAGGTTDTPSSDSTTPSSDSPPAGQTQPTTVRTTPSGFGRRTLRRGSRGADVRYLQSLLGRLGQSTGVDGVYGRGTEAKVRAWERSVNGLVDGRVTPGQANEMRRRAAAGSQLAPQSAQPAPTTTSGYVFPVRGSHTFGTSINRFGAARSGHSHQGQDIMASTGLPIVSVTAGRVASVGYNGGAGNYAVVWGDDRRDYAYYHMVSSAVVSKGQRVSAGTVLGRVGCTGSCSGSHLHFEMWTPHWWDGGTPFDPLPYLRQWDK
jgi:murein DD-endopeptidase MepM/ murein hydrolase activator NlpD